MLKTHRREINWLDNIIKLLHQNARDLEACLFAKDFLLFSEGLFKLLFLLFKINVYMPIITVYSKWIYCKMCLIIMHYSCLNLLICFFIQSSLTYSVEHLARLCNTNKGSLYLAVTHCKQGQGNELKKLAK